MYRSLTWLALKNGVSPSDAEKLRVLAENVLIEFDTREEENRVFINGQEVTKEIRSPLVTKHVSELSAHKGVRKAMVDKQKEMGKDGSVVAEGRDTTTVVFPDADVKVKQDADVKNRAQRRVNYMAKTGLSTSL